MKQTNEQIENCRNYPTCKASLCPLDPNLRNVIWYPDEDICNRRGLPKTDWLPRQRRIAKKATNRDFFFRLADIKAITRIHRSIKGHNPDAPIMSRRKTPVTRGVMGVES